MDSYEHDSEYLIHTRYYRMAFGEDDPPKRKQHYVKVAPMPRWNASPGERGSRVYYNNIAWLKERLADDGIRYDDFVKRQAKNPCFRYYNNEPYDMRKGEEAVRMYNDITGKNEKCISAEDYVKYLKERKMKDERSECNVGRD